VIAFLARYPQMRMETASDARMIDIVAEGTTPGFVWRKRFHRI
jgi:hypothetical protein